MSRAALPPDPQSLPSVLEYAGPDDGPPGPLLPVQARIAFLLVALVAAASAFLPFTYHTAPLDVWIEFATSAPPWDRELVAIATPFFAGLPLAAWHLRRLIRPNLSRVERIAMYAIGGSCAAVTGTFLIRALSGGGLTSTEVGQVLIAPAVLVAGAAWAAWLLWSRRRDEAALWALVTGYAANAAMLLVMMYSPDHPGWWATLVAVAGMGVEGVLTALAGARARRA